MLKMAEPNGLQRSGNLSYVVDEGSVPSTGARPRLVSLLQEVAELLAMGPEHLEHSVALDADPQGAFAWRSQIAARVIRC